jgi:SAM-dependent methyltransferase
MSAAPARDARFAATQAAHWQAADAAHFAWQVGGAGFASLEAELLRPVTAAFLPPYLEVGCGEGANFVHVGGGGLRVGVDRFVDKVRFAAAHVAGVAAVAGDAAALPIATGAVRTVLVRDVLHHVPEPAAVVAEAVRVLAPGGRFFLIEPNGANPLVAAHARLVPAEAGLRASRRPAIERLLGGLPLADVEIVMRQPLPLRRLLLHHRFGLPRLGRVAPVVAALAAAERVAGSLLGRGRWSYIVVTARRTPDDGGARQARGVGG